MDDIEKFRATTEMPMLRTSAQRLMKRLNRKFLRGPIPWDWLTTAAHLPGKTALVALELWRECGCRGSRESIPLSTAKLESFGVTRQAGYAALKRLEAAKLITVDRRRGCLSRVTILESQSDPG